MTVSRLGLSGHWGTIEFGRQTTGIHSVLTANSAIGGSNAVGDAAYSAGDINNLTLAGWEYRMHDYGAVIDGGQQGIRANNMITYRSPSFGGGFAARVDMARDKSAEQSITAASGTELSTTGLSVTYAAGPLSVAVGTHRVTERDDTQATDDKGRTNAISAKYNLGVVTIHGLFATKKVDDDGVRAINQDVKQIGVTYPVGAWSFRGQYGEGTVNGATDAEEVETQAYQLVAQYSLSKRTSVYAIYGTDEAETSASATAGVIGDSVERTQMAIGLRHTF
jgi:predicted porin